MPAASIIGEMSLDMAWHAGQFVVTHARKMLSKSHAACAYLNAGFTQYVMPGAHCQAQTLAATPSFLSFLYAI